MKRERNPLLGRRPVQWLVAPLLASYVRLVHRTSACLSSNEAHARPFLHEGRPVIACCWHGRLLGILVFLLAVRLRTLARDRPADRRLHAMVSRRNEGRLFEMALRLLRVPRVVGATGAGGAAAVRQVCEAIARGDSVLMMPDGPRGPRERATPGAIRTAALAGVPLLPVGCAIRRGRTLDTWDRQVVPFPFDRLVYAYGEPLNVPRRVSDDEVLALQRLLEQRLAQATAEAEHRVSGGMLD